MGKSAVGMTGKDGPIDPYGPFNVSQTPWTELDDGDKSFIHTEESQTVVAIVDLTTEEGAANRNLIRVAPKLAEALTMVGFELRSMQDMHKMDMLDDDHLAQRLFVLCNTVEVVLAEAHDPDVRLTFK